MTWGVTYSNTNNILYLNNTICVTVFIIIKCTVYTHTHTYFKKWPKEAEMALDSKGSNCKAMEGKSKSDIISWKFTRECVWDAH